MVESHNGPSVNISSSKTSHMAKSDINVAQKYISQWEGQEIIGSTFIA